MSADAIDVVISFDTTGSMYPCLTQLRRNADAAVRRLFKEIPGLRVGVMAHGDYCDEKRQYLLKKVDLTDNQASVLKFIKTVKGTYGGDAPEAYEYALYTARSQKWRAGRAKVFVLIGDDVPHGPKYPANKLKLDWKNELDLLTEAGVKVYGVHAMPGIRKHSKGFYEEVARRTDGLYLTLDQFSYITDLIQAVAFKQHGDEHLGAYEAEVTKARRMNGSLRRMFDTMLGRKAKASASASAKGKASTVKVTGKLEPVSAGRFQVLDVDAVADIRTFIEGEGASFNPGRGFYQLTKSELVQEGKEVVLMDKESGDFYSGDKARALIGLRPGERDKVKPVALDKYLVFIQSTSYNRKLVAGTKLLYEVPDWEHSGEGGDDELGATPVKTVATKKAATKKAAPTKKVATKKAATKKKAAPKKAAPKKAAPKKAAPKKKVATKKKTPTR